MWYQFSTRRLNQPVFNISTQIMTTQTLPIVKEVAHVRRLTRKEEEDNKKKAEEEEAKRIEDAERRVKEDQVHSRHPALPAPPARP